MLGDVREPLTMSYITVSELARADHQEYLDTYLPNFSASGIQRNVTERTGVGGSVELVGGGLGADSDSAGRAEGNVCEAAGGWQDEVKSRAAFRAVIARGGVESYRGAELKDTARLTSLAASSSKRRLCRSSSTTRDSPWDLVRG